MSSARGGHSGFTLIEVVVALAILALTLGVLYESFGWSLRRTAVLERRETALLTAQSLLAEVRSRDAMKIGSETGSTSDGLSWQITTQARNLAIDEQSPRKAFDVTVEVRWGNNTGQAIALQSVEISRVAT